MSIIILKGDMVDVQRTVGFTSSNYAADEFVGRITGCLSDLDELQARLSDARPSIRHTELLLRPSDEVHAGSSRPVNLG